MSMNDAPEQVASPMRRAKPAGWTGSLRFRLAASIAAIVVIGMAGSLALAYVIEHGSRKRNLLASLMEQAHSLEVARKRIDSRDEYAAYVDEYCARMNENISPGHHILVVGRAGAVAFSSHRHSGPRVERALLTADPAEHIIPLDGRRLAQVRLKTDDGGTIIVAQFLDHMEGALRRQMLSRGISTAVIGALIVLLLVAAMRAWVLRPIDELKSAAHEWSRRNFSVRAGLSGTRDVRSLAAEFNRMASELDTQESRRVSEMAKARQIQSGLLPIHLPDVPGLAEVVARYEPAEDVAGDLYDLIGLSDGRAAILVLDVSGHGISAALLTGVAKMALHWRLAEHEELPTAVAHVNRDLVRCLTEGQFVTLCVGVWNPGQKTWTYCAAGHPGGALQTGGAVEHLPSTGPLLGAVEDAAWEARVVDLQPGQRLWLYTDGLIEAGAPDRKLGLDGVEDLLKRTAEGSLDAQASELIQAAASRQRAEAEDDVTIVGLMRV